MKDSIKPLAIIATLIISAVAIFFSIKTTISTSERFIIAVTEAHRSLFVDKTKLATLLDRPVDIIVFSDESALTGSIRSGEADAYVTSPFYFISEFSRLENAKAIFGIESDYYLVSKKDVDNETTKVAVFDPYMSQILQGTEPLSPVTIYGTHDRLVAMDEAYVSHVIIHASYFDDQKHLIKDRMSTKGYTQDLFILTSEWVDFDAENGHALIDALASAMKTPPDKPIEEELLRTMSYLFRLEAISTRYYYADLVHIKE